MVFRLLRSRWILMFVSLSVLPRLIRVSTLRYWIAHESSAKTESGRENQYMHCQCACLYWIVISQNLWEEGGKTRRHQVSVDRGSAAQIDDAFRLKQQSWIYYSHKVMFEDICLWPRLVPSLGPMSKNRETTSFGIHQFWTNVYEIWSTVFLVSNHEPPMVIKLWKRGYNNHFPENPLCESMAETAV